MCVVKWTRRVAHQIVIYFLKNLFVCRVHVTLQSLISRCIIRFSFCNNYSKYFFFFNCVFFLCGIVTNKSCFKNKKLKIQPAQERSLKSVTKKTRILINIFAAYFAVIVRFGGYFLWKNKKLEKRTGSSKNFCSGKLFISAF